MRFSTLLITFSLLITSCGSDGPSAETATVTGDWSLDKGYQNGQESPVMEGLTMEFQPDGTFITNLMGNDTPGNYEWAGDEIITTGVKLPLTYNVLEITDSTMNLRSSYRGFQFDFEMVRRSVVR